jgi:hypothetical protein
MTLHNLLTNPAYAGAYAYGRRRVDPRRARPGRPRTGRTTPAPAEWAVLLPDRLPAYIPWMVCSQLTVPDGGAPQWESVAYLDVWRVRHHTLDQELDDLPPAGEGGRLQAAGERGPERFEVRGHDGEALVILRGGRQGGRVAPHRRQAGVRLTPAGPQLVQGEGTGRIGIHQPLDLAVELGLAPLERLPAAGLGGLVQPSLPCPSHARGEHGRIA